MEGQIIKKRNVYTSYGKPTEVIISLDKIVSDLQFFSPENRVDRNEVEALLLRGEEIWTINSTYFLKGGKSDDARRK